MRMLTLLLFTLAPILLAEGPEFVVASIKPFVAPSGPVRLTTGGGPGTADPLHMTQTFSLKKLLATAFDVQSYRILGGDDATNSFEFGLVLPEGASKEDVPIMWRNLLISRFGLKYHMEQREFQVDELTVAPKGHKLTENPGPAPPPATGESGGPARLVLDEKARPINEYPGLSQILRVKEGEKDSAFFATMVARAQPISALAQALSAQLGHIVVDKTGLTGKYDFSMDFEPPQAPVHADLEVDDLPAAVQQQLGLRLTKGKAMLDVVVVDKINRTPTEN